MSMSLGSGQEPEAGGEEDTCWYVCTDCHQAFSDLTGVRTHKWSAHKSKGLANVMILSQGTDLAPTIRLTAYKSGSRFRETPENVAHAPPAPTKLLSPKTEASVEINQLVEDPFDDGQAVEADFLVSELEFKEEVPQITQGLTNNDKMDVIVDEKPKLRPRKSRRLQRPLAEHEEEEAPIFLPSPSPASESEESEFEELEELEEQKANSSNSGRKNCQKCSRSYVSQDSLDRHFAKAHGGFSDKEVRSLIDAFVAKCGENGPCSLCYKSFPGRFAFRRHVHKHLDHLIRTQGGSKDCACIHCCQNAFLRPAGRGLGLWECKLCKTLLEERTIRRHMRTDHPEHGKPSIMRLGEEVEVSEWRKAKLDSQNKTQMVGMVKLSPSDVECSSGSSLKCPICPKTYKSKGSLRNHMKEVHLRAPAPKMHLCSDCGRRFKYKAGLEHHARSHDPENPRPFVCDICGKSFSLLQQMQSHKLTHEVPSVLCPECGKMFKGKDVLKSHVRRVHDKILNFKCNQCGKRFPDNKGLERHMVVHKKDGDTPFECPMCPKSFKDKERLAKHRRNLHSGRVHACRVCGQEFRGQVGAQQHELEAHDFQRAPNSKIFKCGHEGCGRRFVTKLLLDQHQVTHKEEQCLKCDTCGKGFKLKQHLSQHKMTHVPYEEWPYVCDICGKRSGWPAHAREHKRKMHGVDA